MNNFLEGMRAVFGGLTDLLLGVTNYPLFWGFSLGFLVSTLVHAFLMTDNPRQIPTVLFQDKSTSFEKLYPRKANGTYAKSYADFSKAAKRTKILFSTAFFLLLLLILLVIFI